jgi:hypothetical protein
MIVGADGGVCDPMDVDTDGGMPTTSIAEVVLAAQQKWSHCLLPSCAAPDGSTDTALIDACAGVVLTAASVGSDCVSVNGCVFVESSLSIASLLCEGEACGTEFEIGTTTVELAAVDTADMSEATCSFSVTVTDNEPPVIDEASCPVAMVAAKGSPPWPTIATTDNSGDVQVVSTVAGESGELTVEDAPTGPNPFVFTASDASGNEAACSATFGLW